MKDALALTLLVGPTFADPGRTRAACSSFVNNMNARPDIDQTPDDGADHLRFPRQA